MSAPDNFVLTDSTYDSFVVGIDGQNEFKVWQGLVGAHYTPYVDGAGNLSWTNNGGLPNPPTVNVTGKGLTITGIVATTGDLPATANQFDTYLVGTADPYYAYMYYENAWVNIGAVGKGEQGDPGFSPVVTVSPITGGHQISITDAEDTETFDVMDGANGQDGVGVPSGGTTGQVLAKASGTDYDTEWVDQSGGGGTVQSVNNVAPDQTGNITLTADDIGTDEVGVSVQDMVDNYVHVGASAPTDASVKLWLDTDEPGMSGVSSVNGATGTVVLDLADIGFAELIWENANKVTDGTFAAQTITVDTSAYDYLLVVFCMHSHWPTSLATQIIKNGTVSYIFAQTWGGEIQPGQALQTYTRKVDASSTSGITFGTAYYGTSSSAGTLNVPYYIYGIKG